MSTVIEVENLYKQYRLGQVSTGSIAHDLNRWWHTVRGKEDPYEKITGVNNREASGSNDYVWALQDINFSVKQGEVLGIIGRNGAGKSTLLKILSKVTSPTKGNIKVKGRIASLLEVGTGFHPELTGRENIFLNGAILGMTKSEIRAKFDEIVAFSGVEKYIDTPVKRYSSGMYVRLAFAVAAHLEPEILIVDEVLAVGDAEFQKKCLGKMKDVSGEGRTVLFVSHNMSSVQSLCTRGMLLGKGGVQFYGDISMTLDQYLTEDFQSNHLNFSNRIGSGSVKIRDVLVYTNQEHISPQTGRRCIFKFLFSKEKGLHVENYRFDFRIDDIMGNRLLWLSTELLQKEKLTLNDTLEFLIPKLPLNEGQYIITTFLIINNQTADWVQNITQFSVVAGDFYQTGKSIPLNQSKLYLEFDYSTD